MFSIGYATKDIITYIEQLQHHKVTVVADIRSVPYSKAFFDYHQEALKNTLKSNGIAYVYLGAELGPRSKDPQHYNDEQQVQFDRLMNCDLFKSGIERLFSGIKKGYAIALSCAEKDPAICHRSLLVGWSLLHQYEHELQHIRHNGELESQTQMEQRLMQITDTVPDMLTSETDALHLAYKRQCVAYAYRIPEVAR